MMADVLVAMATFAGLVPCVWFVVGYWVATGGQWVKDEAGIFLMSFMTIMGLLFTIGIIGIWFEGTWLTTIAMVLFIGLIAQMWWPLRLLTIAQRNKKSDQEEK